MDYSKQLADQSDRGGIISSVARAAHSDSGTRLSFSLPAHKKVAAYERVLHKEERDIVEDNELPYDDCRTRLDEARVEFRQLNRQIRAASFEVEVEYADEQ